MTTSQPQLQPQPIEPKKDQEQPETLIDLVTNVLSLLLISSLAVQSFIGRWQSIRTQLTSLRSSLSSLSSSPHWSQNPLLHTLLPSLLSTLQRLQSLANQCTSSSFPNGKLHLQSDLNMASASLSNHLNNLDLLLRSGVLYQSKAIVLSHPTPGSDKDDLVFFIRDLFTRLQIGGVEFKTKALESLLQLLEDDKKCSSLVAKEGNIGYLINLLDANSHIREQAISALSILVSRSEESRKIVFEECRLGPLLRVLETGSMPLKEKAAMSIEAITAYPDNAWAVSANRGVAVLIEACRSGSQATQTHAVGAIKNVAAVDDVKMALVEEGAVPVLLHLLNSTSIMAKEKAASCVAALASSGENFRGVILQERGLSRLTHLIQDSSSADVIEPVLRALTSLSLSDSTRLLLSSSTSFVIHLGELIKHGNMTLQQLSVSLLASLSISDGNKRAIASSIPSLVKLMECPKPVGLQESATVALVSLLTVRSNRKEFVRDEKCVMKLVQMLDPNYEVVAKKFPVMVMEALLSGRSKGCQKRLVDAGAHQKLQGLVEMDVDGAKKVLQKLAGNRIKRIFTRSWRE